MFEGAKPCRLKVALVFDRDHSCIEIKARFDRENTSMSPFAEQTMAIKFYADCIDGFEYLKISQVKEKDKLPPGLKNSPRACLYCNDGKMSELNMEYHPSSVIAVGLHNELDFTAPAKMRCIKALQQVLRASELQLYLPIDETSMFVKKLSLLKSKMTLELSRPFMSEYRSKQNNYV